MQIVIGGHVDHGKSTVVGRLLADTGSLPEGKLEQVKALCERTFAAIRVCPSARCAQGRAGPRHQNRLGQVFFMTALRHYVIMDAPGHIEFLKNKVTGARAPRRRCQ
jgi:bifunctional enzyme CysN/CysC